MAGVVATAWQFGETLACVIVVSHPDAGACRFRRLAMPTQLVTRQWPHRGQRWKALHPLRSKCLQSSVRPMTHRSSAWHWHLNISAVRSKKSNTSHATRWRNLAAPQAHRENNDATDPLTMRLTDLVRPIQNQLRARARIIGL